MAAEDKTQVSLRVPASMLADFERIATALGRDRNWVMLRAFRNYLDGEGGHLLHELKGLEELDAGHVVDFDEVMGKADTNIAAACSTRQTKVG
jgi:predicted transcriptional regulator